MSDVLDAYEAGAPPFGDDQVEQRHDEHGERGLAGDEPEDLREVRGAEEPEDHHDPQAGAVDAEYCEHSCRDRESDGRPGCGLEGGAPGVERVRAQHRQRPERDPERMLHRR